MRIISGKYKGRRLVAPSKLPVRPTTDLAKESLFNILNNHFYFEDLSVLDLFSGTGNISYEFVSRGCKNVIAVDVHPACVQFIRKTSDLLNANIQVIGSNVYAFLEKTYHSFDVIFADPPYDFTQNEFEKIISLVFKNQLLNSQGMLIIEHSSHTDLSENIYFNGYKKYGGSVFSFFVNEFQEEDE